MTGERESILQDTANHILDARRTGRLMDELPAGLIPANMDEVYAVQDIVAGAYGPIGGWKIGAPTPEATPLFAPMPAAWIAADGSLLSGERWRFRGLEAEIAFLVGEDLPPRSVPYTREEVIAAMASCHPAIEVLEVAFTDVTKVTRLSSFADLQMHGGFVYGPAYPGWQSVDFNAEHVALTVDGVIRVERTGSNTSGDLVKLLPWLANEGAARTGGLRKGQWITTGSWTGNTPSSPGSSVEVRFSTVGCVSLRFA
ncbi:MAG TPA: fumarylacetoacetate hydrolase family protein [Acidobacteriaceae bacterium]|jgi:2-keto-4-pentenoate hydratase